MKNQSTLFEKKKSTWNVRCLVDESFVPSAQQTSALYCRLTDFWRVCASSALSTPFFSTVGNICSEDDGLASYLFPQCARLGYHRDFCEKNSNSLPNVQQIFFSEIPFPLWRSGSVLAPRPEISMSSPAIFRIFFQLATSDSS